MGNSFKNPRDQPSSDFIRGLGSDSSRGVDNNLDSKIDVPGGTTPDPTRAGTVLVVDGPFRFTRNPMYLSWELVCIGVGLAANIWWPIVMAVPAAFVTRLLVINEEESYLERRFGAEYGDYKARVRRWV